MKGRSAGGSTKNRAKKSVATTARRKKPRRGKPAAGAAAAPAAAAPKRRRRPASATPKRRHRKGAKRRTGHHHHGLFVAPGKGLWKKRIGKATVGDGVLTLFVAGASAAALLAARRAGIQWRIIGGGALLAGLVTMAISKGHGGQIAGTLGAFAGAFVLANDMIEPLILPAPGAGGTA